MASPGGNRCNDAVSAARAGCHRITCGQRSSGSVVLVIASTSGSGELTHGARVGAKYDVQPGGIGRELPGVENGRSHSGLERVMHFRKVRVLQRATEPMYAGRARHSAQTWGGVEPTPTSVTDSGTG